MGRAPAVVIIARHGARLDAADEKWHTTSPTPYDTPLSYGGWLQTRILGSRIAAILHARDTSIADGDAKIRRDSATAPNDDPTQPDSSLPRGTRKHKVVIHSSPFLRCIQSSIAIGVGMSEYHGKETRRASRQEQAPSAKVSRLYSGPSRAQTLDSKTFDDRITPKSDALSSAKDENATAGVDQSDFEKPILRVDACLGEWLSPSYYEFITAPPPSNMMVAGAKAELLRSGDDLKGAKIVDPDGSVTLFPGGDAAEKPVHIARERAASYSMATLARALLAEEPTGLAPDDSMSSLNGGSKIISSTDPRPGFGGYIPPVPTYALGHSAPIPPGYVAHARNACLEVDFQWDSMKGPQQWGDGGNYGEEWSAMHRRFRSGLSNMISWYASNSADIKPQHGSGDVSSDKNRDEEDADLVLIIVTHGAGSNALIGALTNQPVLMDVGMASLTMAVRKPRVTAPPIERQRSTSIAGLRRRASSAVDVGLSLEYDMKILASTDHLRQGSDSLQSLHSSSPRLMPSIPEASRTGASSNSSGTASPIEPGERTVSRNSALGSMRRTTVKSSSSRTFSPAPLVTSDVTSNGLWGARASEANPSSPGAEIDRKFADNGLAGRLTDKELATDGDISSSSVVSTSGHGLWGAKSKDEPTKRRWTVGARR